MRFVCTKDYAEHTGLDVKFVRRLCRRGLLPCILDGKRYQIDREAADAFLKEMAQDNIRQGARLNYLDGIDYLKDTLASVDYRRENGLPV